MRAAEIGVRTEKLIRIKGMTGIKCLHIHWLKRSLFVYSLTVLHNFRLPQQHLEKCGIFL